MEKDKEGSGKEQQIVGGGGRYRCEVNEGKKLSWQAVRWQLLLPGGKEANWSVCGGGGTECRRYLGWDGSQESEVPLQGQRPLAVSTCFLGYLLSLLLEEEEGEEENSG